MMALALVVAQAGLFAWAVSNYAATGTAGALGSLVFIGCMFAVTTFFAIRIWAED